LRKRICCIKYEKSNALLNFYVRKFNSDKYNRVKNAYNMFNTIISELSYHGILSISKREGYTNGQGYKRFVIIYDIDKIREIRRYFKKVMNL